MKKHGHAVVLGGGVGGMSHAAVLARHFERVTILESDVVTTTQPEARSGVAQGQQLHALLKRGWNIFERFLPGFTERLVNAGVRIGEFGPDIRWYMNGTWWSPEETGFRGLGMTRPFLEFHLRARLLEEPSVTFRGGLRVRGLVLGKPGVVTAVDAETLATATKETVEADLIVDCTGRNSKASSWLTELGFEAPPIQEVDIGITYVTQVVRLARDPGFITCYLAPEPPHNKRFGMVVGSENGLTTFLVGSYLGERPPTTVEGMLEFARSLAKPQVADAVAGAETISPPTPYFFKSNCRRAYGSLRTMPERFVVAGDATCSFNPVYGQGMTSAGLAAEVLHELLAKGTPLDGLSLRFQKKLDTVLDQPWMAALANDFQFPEVKGPRNALLSFVARYSKHVLRSMHHNAVQKRFLPVLNMTGHPASLFHPILLGAATLSWLGLLKPNPTFPPPTPRLPSSTQR